MRLTGGFRGTAVLFSFFAVLFLVLLVAAPQDHWRISDSISIPVNISLSFYYSAAIAVLFWIFDFFDTRRKSGNKAP